MNRPIILLFVLTLVTFTFPTTLYHYFPAVSGQSGQLVKVVVFPFHGSNKLLVEMPPRVGETLEQSLLIAKQKAGLKGGVVVDFVTNQNQTDFIDGPSGGALFTTLFYALAHNQTIRHDAIMTGTVNKNNSIIGAVGGLYDKVCASAKQGYRYFLMPNEPLEEYIGALLAAKRCGITLYLVNNTAQAISFMVYDKDTLKKPQSTPPKPQDLPPNLQPYPDAHDTYLKNVCALIVNYEAKLYNQTKEQTGVLNVSRYYATMLKNEHTLLTKGYFYSAANDAFIDSGVLNEIKLVGTANVSQTIQWAKSIQQNARSVPTTFNITTANIDWVMSAQARSEWAYLKAGSVEKALNPSLPLPDQIDAISLLTYSQLWEKTANYSAHVAQKLSHNGTAISRVALKRVALKWEHRLDQSKIPYAEQWHFYAGEDLMSKGEYAGALFCFAYVQSAIDFSKMVNRSNAPQMINSAVKKFRQIKFNHSWVNAYASQATYVSFQGKNETALSTFLLAYRLHQIIEEAQNQSKQMNTSCVCPQPRVIVKKVAATCSTTNEAKPAHQPWIGLVLAAVFGGVVCWIIFYFAVTRKRKK